MKVCNTISAIFSSAILSLCSVLPASTATLTFRSQGIAASINTATGQLTNIRNLEAKESYSISSDACRIVTANDIIDLAKVPLKMVSHGKCSCAFEGIDSGILITRTYSFPTDRAYLNRRLAVRNTQNAAVVLKFVTDCSLRFAKPFVSAALHNDNINGLPKEQLYLTSINVFMRGVEGGLCVGLKYPYFKSEQDASHITSSYEVNYQLTPGQCLELPTMFCAAFKKTGYTCRKELNWTPRIITTTQEEMDWGEVRSMQQEMRDYLPEQPAKWPGYFMWLDCWWAGAQLKGLLITNDAGGYRVFADLVNQSKCLDAMSPAPVWLGLAAYGEPSDVIANIGVDALFPKDQQIALAMEYAHSRGVDVIGYGEPNAPKRLYRKDRPDLKWQPGKDVSTRSNDNCHASGEYEDWFFRLICNAIDTCKLAGWAFDYSWLKRPAVCYGEHGHEPGNCEFQQYRNATALIAKLRDRHPNLFIEIYWGLKEGGPWALRNLNSLENNYENAPIPKIGLTCADDLRFQHWYNHNYRFIPTYMNLAIINFGKETNGTLYSVLSSLNASTHAMLADWTAYRTESEADAFFAPVRTWKAWATRNLAYLKDRVDLFGQPCRPGGIDGTAHIIGDKGFIFVFNPWPEIKWGAVPLNNMIGLTKGSRFALDEISTGERKRTAVCAKGDNFVFSISGKSARLFEIAPTRDRPNDVSVPAGTDAEPAFGK